MKILELNKVSTTESALYKILYSIRPDSYFLEAKERLTKSFLAMIFVTERGESDDLSYGIQTACGVIE